MTRTGFLLRGGGGVLIVSPGTDRVNFYSDLPTKSINTRLIPRASDLSEGLTELQIRSKKKTLQDFVTIVLILAMLDTTHCKD